jgi:very-short-patch-repair endonuclease
MGIRLKRTSTGEVFLEELFKVCRIPFVREYRFHPVRKFRFDFALPDERIAVEYEGSTWAGGRHTRGTGYSRDCVKYNLATVEGWRVLRYTSDALREPDQIINDVRRLRSGHRDQDSL